MSLKLLTISSDPAVIRQVQSTFEPLGCEVGTCLDRAEGRARMEQEKVHGVLVDLRDEGDDLALIRGIRRSRLNATTPVVLATQREDATLMRVGFSAGANFVVGTPLSAERLRSLFVVLRVLMTRAKIWHVRLPFQTTVKCRQGEQFFETMSVNVSERGMLLEGDGPLGVGERAHMEFALPRYSRPIQARGKVVRRDAADRLGVHFFDIAPDQQQTLQRFLAEQLQN